MFDKNNNNKCNESYLEKRYENIGGNKYEENTIITRYNIPLDKNLCMFFEVVTGRCSTAASHVFMQKKKKHFYNNHILYYYFITSIHYSSSWMAKARMHEHIYVNISRHDAVIYLIKKGIKTLIAVNKCCNKYHFRKKKLFNSK